MNHDPNDTRRNPFQPTARAVRDPAHDAQLLRELAIVNARTAASLGALPAGGLPVQPRRKPELSYQPWPAPSEVTPMQEDDSMRLHQIAAAALLPLAVAGCAHTIDAGSAMATVNPHPVKRYEVIVTSEAPGPWDSIKGRAFFDVINKKCVPEGSFTGERNMPNTGIDVDMIRAGKNTWKGYFYRDALEDENYFDLGVCHWDVTSVGISAVGQGVRFNWGDMLDDLLRGGQETWYFKKSVYGNQAFARWGAPMPDPIDAEIRKHTSDYFPVSLTIEEATP